MTRVCNSPETRFDLRFGNKILEMHHLFPTLLYPIRKERRLSILFLYLLINVVCNFLIAKPVCTTSFPSHSIIQVCTTRDPPSMGVPLGHLSLSYASVLCPCLRLCLVSLSYVSVLCSVLCICLPVTAHISPLP